MTAALRRTGVRMFTGSLGFSQTSGNANALTVAALDDKQTKLNVALGGSFFAQTLTPGSTAKAARAFPAARAAMDFRHRLTELAYVQQTAEYLPAIGDNSEPPVRNSVQRRTTDTFFSSGLTLRF